MSDLSEAIEEIAGRLARSEHLNGSAIVYIRRSTAHQVASARIKSAGWNVVIVDHRPFGGTCALRGCDPKKMLISGAESIDPFRRMHGHGVEGELRIEWRDLARISHRIECIEATNQRKLLCHNDLSMIRGARPRRHGESD